MDEVNLFAWVVKQAGADKLLKWGWKAANWTRAWNAYTNRVKENYGKLFVLGKADAVPIEDIYTAVNVLEKPSALRRYSPDQLHELFLRREALWLEKDKRQSGMELVKTGKNLYILGKPGAGKTTFLKNVAIKAVDGSIGGKSPEMTPIFISLHAHANSGRTLLESVEHELSICGFPDTRLIVETMLHSGRALVLFDGLDEVKQENDKRSQLIQHIREFMNKYHECQFLMTCRVAATEYEFDNVTTVEMADFDNDQIKIFIENWFDDTERGKECFKELNKEENKGLLELARVPLLLTLLALTYEEIQTFPSRRVEIYEEALDALLKKWDARRHIQRHEPYKTLSLGRKRQMFARIAAQNFEANKFLIPEAELAKQITEYVQKLPDAKEDIDGQAVLESIAAQHGIFVERANKVYSFAHLSFQEFYTAKYIVGSNTFEGLLKHVSDDEWREVFLLTASLFDEKAATVFFKLFTENLNKLAGSNNEIQSLFMRAETHASIVEAEMPFSYNKVAIRAYIARLVAVSSSHSLNFDGTSNLSAESLKSSGLDSSLDKMNSFIIWMMLLRENYHVVPPDDREKTRNIIDLTTFEQKILALTVPSKNSTDGKWHDFENSLKSIQRDLEQYMGINHLSSISHDANFTWSQESHDTFLRYSKASRLFTDCLKLAVVEDRENIVNSLFLPVK